MRGDVRARYFRGALVVCCFNIPDRQDATSLSETRLLLDTADTLLEDGGDLGGSSLGIGVGACLYGADGGGGASCLWWWEKPALLARRSECGGVLGSDWIRDPKGGSQVPVPIQPQPQPQLLESSARQAASPTHSELPHQPSRGGRTAR